MNRDDEWHEDKGMSKSTTYLESAESAATKYALTCEKQGMRVSYDELRRILAEGMDPTQSAFLSGLELTRSRETTLLSF